jgi:predicted RNA binding protein YcfA (HicA-like mRNA interferase family)
MKLNELIRLIEKDGWVKVRTKGSHIQFKHPLKKGTVTIPFHGNQDIPKWLEISVLKQAGLK